MRIQVKAEGHNISIPIPTGLIFSKPSVWLWLKIARNTVHMDMKYIPEDVEKKADDVFSKISDEAMYAFCAEIMRIKRKYGHWDLVEVKVSSGEEVLIRL